MRKQQRLILCLDGTWNNMDDSTNVLHHFTLALNGQDPAADNAVVQRTYYGEGVGTGVLDGFTGGSFGFGLEQNVRKAYDWLVENYRDDDEKADEIYIFGFSRGAFTARSLVGFISTFGILRRGAPISVNQLWHDYCLLGRAREGSSSIWDRLFGKPWTRHRRLNDLIADPWNVERIEQRRSHPVPFDELQGLLVDPRTLNPAERLLATWSRRARITFLGVYDTVGAIGLDALAIPGLTSTLAMHHNMRPTTLIQHCRHALAVDEHRGAFSHTPFLEFVGHGNSAGDGQLNALEDARAEQDWRRSHEQWRRKIEQRWFVGAHSNIGGGYPDNELAQIPLRWLVAGACAAGLECEDVYAGAEIGRLPLQQLLAGKSPRGATAAGPRDSYAEFASPYYTAIIRGKRYYRRIDPPPGIRASTEDDEQDDGSIAPGYSLPSINEQVDPTVFQFAARVPAYRPPNLHEWAKRKLAKREPRQITDPVPADIEPLLPAVAAWSPRHDWLGAKVSTHLILVLWATFGAFGLVSMNELFAAGAWRLSLWSLGVTALLLPLIDWVESSANFLVARGSTRLRHRAMFDAVYWMRSLGVVLAVCGAAVMLFRLWDEGWNAPSLGTAWNVAWGHVTIWWRAPALAAVGVIAGNLFDRAPLARQARGVAGAVLGVGVFVVFAPVVAILGWTISMLLTPMLGASPVSLIALLPAPDARLAGELLLLQVAVMVFLNSLSWVATPMRSAKLGSIVWLQLCITPSAVRARLEKWREKLACRWGEPDESRTRGPAARAMRRAIRGALWRDMVGFMPVYAVVFAYGLWFASHQIGGPYFGFLDT
ncbi:MAG: DUF2235 domain-containing protein, partial [Gemmatimonadaceae bacterium]